MARRDPPSPPRLERRAAHKLAPFRLLIFCEGKNTEPSYFEVFAHDHANNLVDIECIGAAGAPMTLVSRAKEAKLKLEKSKNSFEKYDQVWAVFDRDEHPYVEQALDIAKTADVKVAFSNPCFELWLLLHYRDFDAPDSRFEVQKKLEGHDDTYKPSSSKEVSYSALASGYTEACKRAIRMRKRRDDERTPMGEPYTDVDVLTQLIVLNGRNGDRSIPATSLIDEA